ncbi:30S ribosomal protein S4 [Frankia sp. AgPm24]|uniref:Small ribosomal subunit protein uS4 n=1 Tax=Frankia umida TaxID=573489 RepID=A0ABT0JUI1_9ACTN|nr:MULTISPECIES: 30S ribosomal protein S4 [Frankia]MCK9874668.1 30S ribosomal protein S4 [Frankia umida]MCK9922759.1 30S ribosomal protein S4 [Frankia sp. AgPm24]
MRHQSVITLSRKPGLSRVDTSTRHRNRHTPAGFGHEPRPSQVSPYRERLREKQQLCLLYRINDRQLRAALQEAVRRGGPPGPALLESLETRLDATVWRSGLARTIHQARQFVLHGHIQLNGQRVERPGQLVQPGDTVTVTTRSRAIPAFRMLSDEPAPAAAVTTPPHLEVRHHDLAVIVSRRPRRCEIPVACDEQLVVEYLAR